MESQEILERAREGDPKVLAAVLNHALKPLGIRTQAAKRDRTLHIVLEADPSPNPAQTTLAVRKLISELDIQAVDQIILYGQQVGEESVAWRQDLSIQSDTIPVTSSSDSFSAPESPTPETPVSAEPTPPDTPAPSPMTSPASLADKASPSPTPQATMGEPSSDAPVATSAPPPVAIAQSDETSEVPEVLRRPEAVVILFWLVLVTFWEIYLDLAIGGENALSASRLAKRLQVSPSTISRRKRQEDFTEWSRSLDPEGTGWFYENGLFWPLVGA